MRWLGRRQSWHHWVIRIHQNLFRLKVSSSKEDSRLGASNSYQLKAFCVAYQVEYQVDMNSFSVNIYREPILCWVKCSVMGIAENKSEIILALLEPTLHLNILFML